MTRPGYTVTVSAAEAGMEASRLSGFTKVLGCQSSRKKAIVSATPSSPSPDLPANNIIPANNTKATTIILVIFTLLLLIHRQVDNTMSMHSQFYRTAHRSLIDRHLRTL